LSKHFISRKKILISAIFWGFWRITYMLSNITRYNVILSMIKITGKFACNTV